ncbi:MAG: hypothetical protein U1E20_07335 [Methylocystis sp.]|uniref:hypothetical protein n=1 Tax=Methylocystis sp. TaxID=1911079 RepID=UPI00395FD91C
MRASTGNIVAVLGALVMAGVLAFSGYSVTEAMNAVGCTAEVKKSATLNPNVSVVVPPAQKAFGSDILRSFELNGPLCIALNGKKYPELTKGKSLKLFIDDIDAHIAIPIAPNADSGDWLWTTWPVRVADQPQAQSNWKKILGGARLLTGQRSVSIGLGDAEESVPRAVTSEDDKTTLVVFKPILVLAGLIGLLLVAGGLIIGNLNSGLLRDGSGHGAGLVDGKDATPYLTTFSLSKVGLGLWSILTIGCFILLWVVTGKSDGIITPEVLTLLGIQGSSGLASVLMDSKEKALPSSGNFLTDILSDGQTVTLYRIQMLAWTLILVAIFLWSVLSQLSFPKFDSNLLLLAGIANGYYLGFKWPEGQK